MFIENVFEKKPPLERKAFLHERESIYAFSLLMIVHTRAARAAPARGARMKIQISQSPVEFPANESKIAGASDLAGFTDVLVTGIETKWMRASASPIATPANPAGALLLVAPKITRRKMKVITNSITSACPVLNPNP